MPLPFGVRIFTREEAAALGQQRAFRLHLNRQARVPVTTEWFPDLDSSNQGALRWRPRAYAKNFTRSRLNWISVID